MRGWGDVMDAKLWSVERRLQGKHVVTESGCWEWQGTIRKEDGYPVLRYRYKQWRVHRFVYAIRKGELVDGMEIDHTCNNRRCVNPAHLEQVTSDENNRRAAERRNACRRGHPRTPDNLLWGGHSYTCRECANMRARLRRATQKAA